MRNCDQIGVSCSPVGPWPPKASSTVTDDLTDAISVAFEGDLGLETETYGGALRELNGSLS